MKLELKLKSGTTVAQAEEMFKALLKIQASSESFMTLIEDIKLTPGEIS